MFFTSAKIVCFPRMSPAPTCEPIFFGSNMKIFHLLQIIKQILSIKACNQQKKKSNYWKNTKIYVSMKL